MDARFYKALNRLSEDIFACFLQSDYENNLYLYEHRIHSSKTKCMSLMLSHANNKDLSQLQAIYNGLIDCGLLRWRVKDKSIFNVCRTEMLAISLAIHKLLKGEDEDFSAQIMSLESINQSVLQVAANEPLAFILFIAGLKALKENCLAIHRSTST